MTQPAATIVDDPRLLPEAALVAAARDRDEGAVRELIHRLNPRLFHIARGILDSDAEAEEAVQEAYLSAFTRIAEFRGEARFSTWVTSIALNAARARRRARRETLPYDTVAETAEVIAFPGPARPESAEMQLGRHEVRTVLEDAVAQLPPELRVVFLMRETDAMSIREIARTLSLNPITVKTRLFRARRRLREALERRFKGGFEAIFPFNGHRCAGLTDRVVAGLFHRKNEIGSS